MIVLRPSTYDCSNIVSLLVETIVNLLCIAPNIAVSIVEAITLCLGRSSADYILYSGCCSNPHDVSFLKL